MYRYVQKIYLIYNTYIFINIYTYICKIYIYKYMYTYIYKNADIDFSVNVNLFWLSEKEIKSLQGICCSICKFQ